MEKTGKNYGKNPNYFHEKRDGERRWKKPCGNNPYYVYGLFLTGIFFLPFPFSVIWNSGEGRRAEVISIQKRKPKETA